MTIFSKSDLKYKPWIEALHPTPILMCWSLQVDIATSNILHTDLPFIHSFFLTLPSSLYLVSLSLISPFSLSLSLPPSLSLLCLSADLMSKSHLDILLLFDLVYFGRLTIYGYMLYIYTWLLYHSDAIDQVRVYIALAVQLASAVYIHSSWLAR